jgi:hypothetical protein
MHAYVPPHKTLFGAPKNKGLPIGNLNSQFFANVYLTGFDHFVKHTLKCRHYLRYCDDFVLLAPEYSRRAGRPVSPKFADDDVTARNAGVTDPCRSRCRLGCARRCGCGLYTALCIGGRLGLPDDQTQ